MNHLFVSLFRGEPDNDTAYFPHKLLPQLQRYTRVNKAALQMSSLSVNNGVAQHSGVTLPGLPKSFSPSSIRKMNHNIASKRVNISLCYLGEKQVIGEYILQPTSEQAVHV